MSKKKTDNNKQEPPRSLKNENFYGFDLDEDQRNFIENVWDEDSKIIFCNAKAGSGKTLCALGVANMMYEYGMYTKILYVMSPVQERTMGYRSGDQEEKESAYYSNLHTILLSLGIPESSIVREDAYELVKRGISYIYPMTDTFVRGCTFDNAVIIVDEAQNYTFLNLKKLLTRVGINSKVIVIGQTAQCDLPYYKEESGFQYYLEYMNEISKLDKRARVCNLRTNHRGWVSNICDNLSVSFGGDHTRGTIDKCSYDMNGDEIDF